MKKLTSYVTVALLSLSALAIAAPNDAALEAKEKTAWQSFKDKKADDFQKVVATYTVKIEGTYGSQDMSGTYNAASVWKETKGEWQAIFHTNVKQAAPAK